MSAATRKGNTRSGAVVVRLLSIPMLLLMVRIVLEFLISPTVPSNFSSPPGRVGRRVVWSIEFVAPKQTRNVRSWELAQASGYVQQCARVVISLFPDSRLRIISDGAIAPDCVIDAAEFMVYLFFFDELPLFLKRVEVRIRLLAVFLVH